MHLIGRLVSTARRAAARLPDKPNAAGTDLLLFELLRGTTARSHAWISERGLDAIDLTC
jgi:hypothetical protein